MPKVWILIKDIPVNGKEYSFDEPAMWEEPISEFSLPYAIKHPLSAQVFLLAQQDGVLVRGRIKGQIAVPCDRCAEDAVIDINHEFDTFEIIPDEDYVDNEADGSLIGPAPEGAGVGIEISRLLWEEFVLSLPAKPLCASKCKGLCPKCGKNLNDGDCGCDNEQYDPRLAALRGLKVTKH
ncbi:YceD family protein [Oleidesulfovibrio sp.]|uniref:YceD family protein n=1 Tax=Oleidesulfovibrio sp. TaxID=2909707 RepID=UPI003A847730